MQWQLVQLGESEQLKTNRQILAYMVGAFAECSDQESLWVVCFSVNRWVISRTCLKMGTLVTACPLLRDVARVAILADARGIAIVRGEPSEEVQPTPGDLRLAKKLRDAATALELEWIDYVIMSTRDDAEKPEYYSLRDHE